MNFRSYHWTCFSLRGFIYWQRERKLIGGQNWLVKLAKQKVQVNNLLLKKKSQTNAMIARGFLEIEGESGIIQV